MSQSDQHSRSVFSAEESSTPVFFPTRLVGAELIRQLSCHKLEKFYQSDETLHQFHGAAKRKAAAPIVKRFSDNHHDRHQNKPNVAVKTDSCRPRLTRQSTTNCETVTTSTGPAHNVDNRRRQLAEAKDSRNWRSCDVNHSDVAALAGTHRKTVRQSGSSKERKARSTSESIGRSEGAATPTSLPRPSFLDLASGSVHSLSAGQSAGQSAGTFVSISPSAGVKRDTTVNHENECQSGQSDICPSTEAARQHPPHPQQQQKQPEPVLYTKGGAVDGPEGDRVVLPPSLGGNHVIRSQPTAANKNAKLLSQRMAKAAGSRTKKVLGKQQPGDGRRATRRNPNAAPSAIAVAAIAVAVVTGNDRASDSKNPFVAAVNNPRRRARGIVILTSVFLLFTCLFLVGITLRLAPLIDELGKTRILCRPPLIFTSIVFRSISNMRLYLKNVARCNLSVEVKRLHTRFVSFLYD